MAAVRGDRHRAPYVETDHFVKPHRRQQSASVTTASILKPSAQHQHQQPPMELHPARPGKLTEAYGEPPAVIKRDRGQTGHLLHRGPLLGEGGFARVYAAIEDCDGAHKALKVISKEQLTTTKNRGKLFAEIKLHQSMRHENIVRFDECFEDSENVYMVMELCPRGSLLDLLKKRKRYTEPEARFYLAQLINCCLHMHDRSVIHRDLKLGNLFLDHNMNLKVGDFGLAALVRFPGERKKTICGTPNYIAPEILFDRDNGHSFEVDVWSIGVILYTFLVGKPPFQTKEVKQIYKKIKENAYAFPEGLDISPEAVDLISSILNTDPDRRPGLIDILNHPFFSSRFPCPASLPPSILHVAPDYAHLTPAQSKANIRSLVRKPAPASTEEMYEDELQEPEPAEEEEQQQQQQDPDTSRPSEDMVETAVARQVAKAQETEVRSALAPDSPISELLSSARKPLVVSPHRPIGKDGQPLPRVVMGSLTNGQYQTHTNKITNEQQHQQPQDQQTKISSALPSSKGHSRSSPSKSSRSVASSAAKHARAPSSTTTTTTTPAPAEAQQPDAAITTTLKGSSRDVYEACAQQLEILLSARTHEELTQASAPLSLESPKVFITSWIDYTHKYGTAYQLTDGTAGVFFNDTTTMVLSPDQTRLDYLTNRKAGQYERKNYATDERFEGDTERKVYLLTYFRDYMIKTLERDVDWTWTDSERRQDMDFLMRYYRMKQAIVFKLSNNVLQFNFFDHTKLLLTDSGRAVTFIGPDYKLKTYALASLMREAARLGLLPRERVLQFDLPVDHAQQEDRRQRKQAAVHFMLNKLVYALDVVQSLAQRRHAKSSA